LSYKDIKITATAKSKAESYGITSTEEVKKKALQARYKGLKMSCLTTCIPQAVERATGLPRGLLNELKTRYTIRNNERVYYHNGFVYYFVGDNGKTVKTIIKHESEFVS
jgi:predicted transcriptional regulator with HTH domain